MKSIEELILEEPLILEEDHDLELKEFRERANSHWSATLKTIEMLERGENPNDDCHVLRARINELKTRLPLTRNLEKKMDYLRELQSCHDQIIKIQKGTLHGK